VVREQQATAAPEGAPTHHNKRKEKRKMRQQEAWAFAGSPRGQFIISQALCIAIEEMKKVPAPHTEPSNIADMEYLRDNAFPIYHIVHSREAEL